MTPRTAVVIVLPIVALVSACSTDLPANPAAPTVARVGAPPNFSGPTLPMREVIPAQPGVVPSALDSRADDSGQ